MVAIDHASAGIDRQHPVGVTIKRKPHGGSTLKHGLTEGLKLSGPAVHIDPLTIGLSMEDRQVGAKGKKGLSTTGCGRSPAQIKHDRDPVEPQSSNRCQKGILISLQQIIALAAHAAANNRAMLKITPKPCLDSCLAIRMQFGAIGIEHLDAVVRRGVMAGRHHQAPCGTNLPNQEGNCRRGAETKGPNIAAARRQSCGQSRNEHAAAAAGIHPDQNRSVLLQHLSHPVAHLQAESRRQHRSRMPANSVGPETGSSGTEAGSYG